MNKVYMFLLASLCAIELFAGIIVAPIIFYPARILESIDISQFQSGILMSQVFIKLNYYLLFVSVFSIIYEIFTKQDSKNLKISRFFLSLINLICACIFVFYFADYILKAQELGEMATKTAEFMQIHNASEYVFKIMAIAQFILFFTIKIKK